MGCAIIGQTDDLAPADGRLYGIRDITATVESVPLITASILSKKLAAGLDGLVMDVKTGSGAFATDIGMARELAESIVAVANGANLPTCALITDMNQVLGRAVGNSLEVAEALSFLRNENPESRLREVVLTLAQAMLDLTGLSGNPEAALNSGRAMEIFARMVSQLGGPTDLAENAVLYLPRAPVSKPCAAIDAGTVSAMNTRAIGIAVLVMGGGRRNAASQINPSVGLTEMCAVGERVEVGQPLVIVHAANEADADAAIERIRAAITIGDKEPEHGIILERIA